MHISQKKTLILSFRVNFYSFFFVLLFHNYIKVLPFQRNIYSFPEELVLILAVVLFNTHQYKSFLDKELNIKYSTPGFFVLYFLLLLVAVNSVSLKLSFSISSSITTGILRLKDLSSICIFCVPPLSLEDTFLRADTF